MSRRRVAGSGLECEATGRVDVFVLASYLFRRMRWYIGGLCQEGRVRLITLQVCAC